MTSTTQLVAVVGRGVVASDQALLTADDYGVTRGDGCFDATRVLTDASGATKVDNLDAHISRFARSARRLEIPLDLDAWRDTIDEAVREWRTPGEAVLKLLVTRGLEHTQSGPTQIVTITPLEASAIAHRQGVTVAVLSRGYRSDSFLDAPWLLGGVKTISYAVHTAAKREAHQRNCDDVLFCTTDGYALEAPTAALVWWSGGRLLTTQHEGTGILASITQEIAFSHAEDAGLDTDYVLGTMEEVRGADGCWLLSSVRGVAPVTAFDGVPVRQDAAMTQQLRQWSGFAD